MSKNFRSWMKYALPFIAAAGLSIACTSAEAAKGFSSLYVFCAGGGDACPDGGQPRDALVMDKSGNFYGVTYSGGDNTQSGCGAGCGVVFKVTPSGSEKVLWAFCAEASCSDGQYPNGPLAMDGDGNLYGTTFNGGPGGGTLFKVSPKGTDTTIYSFCSQAHCSDGENPSAGVIMHKGNLYGTTVYGCPESNSNVCGTVFELDSKGREHILHYFCRNGYPACTDGVYPLAPVLRDAAGNFYGSTSKGGAHDGVYCRGISGNGTGCGTVFKLGADGSFKVLYSFCAKKNCRDGATPFGPLTIDSNGNLYGTAEAGGNSGIQNCDQTDEAHGSCGVLFKIAPDGTETVLYAFCSELGCTDGANPDAGVLLAKDGAVLYGTTQYGGDNNVGTVFKITGGALTVLHSFALDPIGGTPRAGLIAKNGYLYGTTFGNPGFSSGSVFQLGTKGD